MHFDEHMKRTSFEFDTRILVENIFKKKSDLMRNFHKDGQRILIGGADFQELMATPFISTQFMFSAQCNSSYGILGMNIEVIPWMRGMIVMP